MELIPAWQKWAYEDGIQEGLSRGMEAGREEGKKLGTEEVIRKFLNKGFSPEVVAETVGVSVEYINKLKK